MERLFKTQWMNSKAVPLILACKRAGIFGILDIVECIQKIEDNAIKEEGAWNYKKDYVGPKGFWTKVIPKFWWNRGAWIHDGWFKFLEKYGEFGFWTFSNANKFFDICNKINIPEKKKGFFSKFMNKVSYLSVSVFGRFAIKKRKK